MKCILLILSVCFIQYSSAIFGIGRTQSAAIRGQVKCHGKPESGVLVKMYDSNALIDSKMGQAKTSSDGTFTISGSASELSGIDPKVNFYHNCDNSAVRCARKFTIKLPSSYVSSGKTPSKTYDFGTMELSGKFPGESHDCIHRL